MEYFLYTGIYINIKKIKGVVFMENIKKFEEMTVEELKKYAKENDMKLTSKVKAKMIKQINEYEHIRNCKGNAFR